MRDKHKLVLQLTSWDVYQQSSLVSSHIVLYKTAALPKRFTYLLTSPPRRYTADDDLLCRWCHW